MLGPTIQPLGDFMSRRSCASIWTSIGTAFVVAVLAAGCGGASATATPAVTAVPTPSASPSVASGGSPSAGASNSTDGSASPSALATDQLTIGLPHVDAALEDLLPGTIGGIDLQKFSMPLSSYIASAQGGDKTLYAPWLVKFAKTPDDVNMAISADLTQRENFVIHAIKVPGVDDPTLSSSFATVARNAGWQVNSKSVAAKTVLEIIDPTAQTTGVLSNAYVYAKGGVLYFVITDDASLLLEALIKLP
jgi:hypothetical protein